MNQDAWVKVAQAFVMFLTAIGIQVTEADVTSIVTGAFGLLSILSAIKAFMSKEKKPTPEDVARVALLDRQIRTEIAKEKAYLKKAE